MKELKFTNKPQTIECFDCGDFLILSDINLIVTEDFGFAYCLTLLCMSNSCGSSFLLNLPFKQDDYKIVMEDNKKSKEK